MRIPIALCAGWLLALGPVAAWAEKADRDKPMNIEADTLRYDDLRQLSVFSGQVVLSKGSILIRGARLEVRQDPDGYQYGTVTAEPGQTAYYRQKREGLDETMEGVAESIEYNGKSDSVRLLKKAELRRYRAGRLNDEFSGQLITYDNGTEVFTVDGNPATPAAPATGSKRIRAMLTPSSAGPDAAPAGAAPALRSSARLAGERP